MGSRKGKKGTSVKGRSRELRLLSFTQLGSYGYGVIEGEGHWNYLMAVRVNGSVGMDLRCALGKVSGH